MSDKHRSRYVALEVAYVTLCRKLKITYPSAAYSAHLPKQKLAGLVWACQRTGAGSGGLC